MYKNTGKTADLFAKNTTVTGCTNYGFSVVFKIRNKRKKTEPLETQGILNKLL